MRKRKNVLLAAAAAGALAVLSPIASLAIEGESSGQPGEDRWVPSLAITSGLTVQKQGGVADSELFEGMTVPSVPLRGFVSGDDLAVSPFVGGALEVMAPALPIPTRPRFFLSGEILPTFASERDLAGDGDPDCLKGPEQGAPCAADEAVGVRDIGFGEGALNGQGSKTTALVDTLVFGASLGVALPLQFGERRLRIKPSVGWISYEVEGSGVVVAGACDPVDRCTNIYVDPIQFGFLRDMTLTASDSQRFNAIGPGLDIEMDTGRYGPLGVSLFIGGRAYRTLGDRSFAFGATESYPASPDSPPGVDGPNGIIPPGVAVATFEVDVDPWLFRGHLGIRFHWLGSQK